MLTQYLGIGGLERMIFSLCVKLRAANSCDPSVFAYDQNEASDYVNLISEFRKEGIPVESYKKPTQVFIPRSKKTINLVRNSAIEIIHSHNLGSLIYASFTKLALRGRVKIVHTQHSFIHLGDRRRYRLYEKFFTRFVDELTVVSKDAGKPIWTLDFPVERVHVISNGIEFPDELNY